MKLEIFRNPSRPWTLNMVRDIDAISHALPYCRVLVIDRDAAALLRRSDAVVRHRSVVVHDLRALPATLDQIDDVQSSAGDAAGWDRIGRGAGNQLEAPKAVHDLDLPDGCRVRLCGPTGPLADHSVEVPSVA